MIPDGAATNRPPIRAATAAAILMLAFGLTYRVLLAQLAAPVTTTALTSEHLAKLPMTVGRWTGVDSPLDPAMVEAADTDAHISRTYSSPGIPEEIWLYVAYGVRARDLMPHRPEVCYVSNGWTLADRTSAELTLDADTRLPCNILQFSRGAMAQQKIVILDYYVVDGLYCRDISALRSMAWKGPAAVESVAQIQILASVAPDSGPDAAGETTRRFAIESARPILQLFTAAEPNQPDTTGHGTD